MSIFEKGDGINSTVTTDQLAKILGGGDCFIRSRDGKVTGMAIKLGLNPEAPGRVLVGRGPRLESLSKKIVGANEFLPVYLKLATNQWQFLGLYKAEQFETDPLLVEGYRKGRMGELSGVLFLVGESDREGPDDRSISGYVADAARRKQIEEAAINYVVDELSKSGTGYTVESVESQNLGFDILARTKDLVRRIEVKGTSADHPAFFLSANEYRASKVMPGWELMVVTEADTSPKIYRFTVGEMRKNFSLEPTAYRCELKS